MTKRRAARAGAVTGGSVVFISVLMMLSSSTALALPHRDEGDDPGPGLSILETVGYFVFAPLALFGLIAALVVFADQRRAGAERAATSENVPGSGPDRATDTAG